jgi:hypothetical protein
MKFHYKNNLIQFNIKRIKNVKKILLDRKLEENEKQKMYCIMKKK